MDLLDYLVKRQYIELFKEAGGGSSNRFLTLIFGRNAYYIDGKVGLNVQVLTQNFSKNETP